MKAYEAPRVEEQSILSESILEDSPDENSDNLIGVEDLLDGLL